MMMGYNPMEVRKRTLEIIAELTEQEVENLDETSTLTDLGVDSLMALEIAVHLEREFDIFLSEEDLANIETIDDILDIYKGID
ncbi:acyl carrier protein [Bacillus cereus]|uniref:Acyl carrier protein n=2 Tax=Bacillus cereus TaxID=1396 RepID=A0AA44Q6U5_BACCE|nr:acyl carrier protein [Bacillus cereus]PFR92622.1 acyl carrier protein [Bacillus cereus]